VVIGGVERTAHFFAFDLPHSDASFVCTYPAATARQPSNDCERRWRSVLREIRWRWTVKWL
jgi:hypothetical protein